MKIKLLQDIPVDPIHGLTKGREVKVLRVLTTAGAALLESG